MSVWFNNKNDFSLTKRKGIAGRGQSDSPRGTRDQRIGKESGVEIQFVFKGAPESSQRPSELQPSARESVAQNSVEPARKLPNRLPPLRQRPYARPRLPIKPRTQWNRIAMVSLFVGAGIAFVAAALIAFVSWYSSRPMQWNAQAIRAHFDKASYSIELEDWYQRDLNGRDTSDPQNPPKFTTPSGWTTQLGEMTVQISYDLENTTNLDYMLGPPQTTGLIPMQRLKSSETLIDGKRLKWSAAEPFNHLWISDRKAILIPAHQTVRVFFFIDYTINDNDPVATSVTDWTKAGVQQEFERHLLKDTDSFVIFDQAHHYRIDLPVEDVVQ